MAISSVESKARNRYRVLRLALLVLLYGAAGAAFLAVMTAPLAFTAVTHQDQDLARLSNIGQTYGTLSAIISACALIVVVRLQRNQIRHERSWLQRQQHLSLIQMAMDDPRYAQCWGPRVAPDHIDERLFYYINLVILLWSYAWSNGELSNETVRRHSANLFGSAVTREYWRMYGERRLSAGQGRQRQFLEIIDSEYRRAVASGPPQRPFEHFEAASSGPATDRHAYELRPTPRTRKQERSRTRRRHRVVLSGSERGS